MHKLKGFIYELAALEKKDHYPDIFSVFLLKLSVVLITDDLPRKKKKHPVNPAL